ncbi:MAG: ATP-binding cassette domain-containing protein [Maricaulaceae bacterium]
MQNPEKKSRAEAGLSDAIASPSSEILRLERVSLRYDRTSEIFSDLTWALPQGRLCFLTGPSGIGKTSLLNLISLDRQPNRGHIFLFGQDVTQASTIQAHNLQRRIGLVTQNFNLIDDLNVFENIALPLRVTGARRDSYAGNVADLINWVGLGPRVAAYPGTLSAGEKQRTAIARAIITRPKLLLADEPTGNVDPEMAQRLLRLFVEMNRLGTTVIIATHNQDLLEQYDADIYTIRDGQVFQTNEVKK